MTLLEQAFGAMPAPVSTPELGTGEGLALGAGSNAVANSVALGAGAVATEAGTVSVGNAGAESRVVHVADAVAATDAVNLRQMQAAQAATLNEARAYTDQRMQALSDQFVELDARIDRQDTRIDRVGAMSSAMMSMSINAAQGRSDRGRLAAGAGWQNGENALSVGYARNIGDRVSISLGGAFSSDDTSAGIGFGIDL
jgi:autotransporter adhesin